MHPAPEPPIGFGRSHCCACADALCGHIGIHLCAAHKKDKKS